MQERLPSPPKRLPSPRKPENSSRCSPERLTAFLEAVRRETRGEVRTDPVSRSVYATDASIYEVRPHGVLIPRDPDDVEAAVRLSAQFDVPILPRAAGTSLAGQAVNEALVIDFTRHLGRILEINAEEGWVRTEPGVVLDDLNRALAPHGLRFGPDPASGNRAAMGGIVGNNATGSRSILYGMTADHVLETDVVLADGTRTRFGPCDTVGLETRCRDKGLAGHAYRTIRTIAESERETILAGTPRHWRRCGGYNLDRFVSGATFRTAPDPRFNLAKLVCGSEGTLAVMTAAKLALVRRPAATALAVVGFDRLTTALSSVEAVLACDPTAVEFMDNLGLTLTRKVPAFARRLARFLDGEPDCILIVEFSGTSAAEVSARVAALRRHLAGSGVPGRVSEPLTGAREQDVWAVRKAGLGLMMSMTGDAKPIPFIEDAAVPVEHLTDYVTRIEAFCRDLGTRVAYYAHASAGCLHIRPVINTKDASDTAKLPRITAFALELLGGYGGCLSSEHGDGRARSAFNEAFFGPALYALFRRVKAAFDPEMRLNPGNITDAAPMTENLRFGAGYRTPSVKSAVDFSDQGGLARAIELCNGAGACRKTDAGTMCPSFMATRDEAHSTRGRANALRALLAGRLIEEDDASDRVHEAMALCVGCKACKTECPSAVDMARIKVDYLARRYLDRGVPLRSRLFARIADLNRLASGWRAPFANALLQNGVVRLALEKGLGIRRDRALPAFARRPFSAPRPAVTGMVAGAANRPEVVLFADTFHTHQEPEVAAAAHDLLEACGFRVTVAGAGCAGRPMLSQGLVDKARREARKILASLIGFAERGVPIVGLEPSCLLAIRDDYPHLLPGDARVPTVAARAGLLEEFLTARAAGGGLAAPWTEREQPILLHDHCHARALVAPGTLARALALPPGRRVTELDAGCCGMAGSFGYEVEHAEVSARMAEHRLLPAVRAADPSTLIVAPGASCRQQIREGAGREAHHPAVVLRDALDR